MAGELEEREECVSEYQVLCWVWRTAGPEQETGQPELSALRNLPAATAAAAAAACPVSLRAARRCLAGQSVSQADLGISHHREGGRREEGEREDWKLFPAGETKICQCGPRPVQSVSLTASSSLLLSLQLPGYFGQFLEIDPDIQISR